jgi:formiminotetrahydrofolate cyclodeaminase
MPHPELAISRQTLTDFVTALGAATPSPGCGAAGAVALALAAGCAAKAFAISHKHTQNSALMR